MKALLIGSNFMEELSDCLDYFDTKIKIINESPLSDEFSLKLENIKEDVDYVLIDLMVCATWLFKQSGRIKTLRGENAGHVFNPATFKCTQIEKNYNRFMKDLLKKYSCNKLFLVLSSFPSYFVTNFQLRNIKKAPDIDDWKQSFSLIKKLEKKFIMHTNAATIDLAKYYFLKKPVGYDVSFVRYEELLYRDIDQWFYDLQNGVTRTKPVFKFKLDRYIMYQYKTIHYKAFYRFLEEENIVDKFLLSSPREYVLKNYENIIKLNHLAERSGNEKIYHLIQNDIEMTEDFKQVVLGFLFLQEGIEAGNAFEYFKQMFRNGIVSYEIKKEIRNYWAKRGLNPNKITSHNAGYYFKMKWGGVEAEAQQFIADNAVIEPTLVDVYGSCIAYQTINEFISGATEVVHNNYYMHVPVYESCEVPVKHPEVVWQSEPADEFEKNVRIQFEHQIEEDIKRSEANWCLIDLYSMIAPRTFLYGDFCFTDYGNKTWQYFGAQNIHPWNGYYQELLQSDEFLEKIRQWTKWLKEKYGENIILVNFKASRYKIGDDNCLYDAYKNAVRKNEITDKVYGLVKEWLGCYCIEFGKEFLADDVGYSSSGPVHYELDFYEEEAAVIQKIITSKPKQKVYKAYSNVVRVNRIIRLAEKNSPDLLSQIFETDLDKIIVSLPVGIIKKYKKEIIEFYDAEIDNRIDLLKVISLLEINDPLYYFDLKRMVFEVKDPDPDKNQMIKTHYDKLAETAVYDTYRNKQMRNTTYRIEFYDGNEFLFAQSVIYGVKTKLMPAPEKNRDFLGWKAYRMSDGKVSCVQKEGKRAFIDEEMLDENNILYLFPNEANVAKNSSINGDVIRMYAVWK